MVTPIQKFQTTDGKVFNDHTDALAHESSLKNGAVVDAFLDKHFPKVEGKAKQGPRRAISRKAILTWLAENQAT